ncbi:HAMP domain-containing histidine kinase [bacterium]|nr:MAG: HAMP domain-containing histidine kinase [bacterium]
MTEPTRQIRTVRNPYHLTVNFKSGLFVLALVIIFGALAYTQFLVERLRDDSRHIVKIYTQIIARIGQDDPEGEYSFIFDEIIKRIEFPIINTAPDTTILSWRNIPGIVGDTLTAEAEKKLKKVIADMDIDNAPIPILYENTTLGYIHYDTDSKLIRQLAWLPVIGIGVVGAFILIGYIGFSNIKRSEQRSIWVGMAKETAHQLGTPLSSLMGWAELLRGEAEGRESTLRIIGEMEVDIKRIDRIVTRFSQIGSASDLKQHDMIPLLSELAQYFRTRMPQLGKTITIEEVYETNATPFINAQLIAWVIENIIKNAVDAIDTQEGRIKIHLSLQNGSVCLDISDNGRGIELKNFYNIFRPGFSTKKRGWGLGLSLAKRIIEDYHNGKIFVKDSNINQGTTIRIQLKKG